jgi:hypothetical protein
MRRLMVYSSHQRDVWTCNNQECGGGAWGRNAYWDFGGKPKENYHLKELGVGGQ